ncbi:MAG: HAMP domain-containing protein [Betaproteobacteria bacterium]|nr:HAMP domain-containing protein [Betaproteobacteria bacterium]
MRGIRVVTFVLVAAGFALIVLLSRASANTSQFAQNLPWLIGSGLVVALGLLGLIGYQIVVLWRKLKERVFGAKLALRLMFVFALMATVPGGLLYAVSLQFFERSIESWFNVPVDQALESGLKLGKAALDPLLNELAQKTALAAQRLTDVRDGEQAVLDALRAELGFGEATLFSNAGKVIAHSGGTASTLPELPSADVLKSSRPVLKRTEAVAERGLLLRAIAPVAIYAGDDETRWLQGLKAPPPDLAAEAQRVESGLQDYQALALARSSLRWIFRLTLTLALLLTLFSAVVLAFLLAERLSAPLSALAESTRAIAKGDYTKLNPVKSRDEFGVLTQSFNTMTRQLAEASEAMSRNQQQLENAKTYLETILGNLTSGVITLDERHHLNTFNAAAAEMLAVKPESLHGLRATEWPQQVPALQPLIDDALGQFSASRDRAWERQIEYVRPDGPRTLLLRGTRLPVSIGAGYVLVFDDITHLIAAQRDAAWGEVARRLAHEIKNPLTPIQLSAERLQHKLEAKLPEAEADILKRSTQTIVAQVGALKGMVDDFSIYSRSSRLIEADVDLNELVREVLVLYESMPVTLNVSLDDSVPVLRGDAALLRQVLHNLMQNAVDALAGVPSPKVNVATHRAAGGIVLAVADNGTGIAEGMLTRIFEPYVTTKPKGTGLGLAIVKKIIDEHHGRVSIENLRPQGACVSITLPLPVGTPAPGMESS